MFVVLALAVVISAPAAGQALADDPNADQPCDISENADLTPCVPFHACLRPPSGPPIFITGRSYGSVEGPLFAEMANGTRCNGHWRRDAEPGGKADVNCDDGRHFAVRYILAHVPTGTAIGKGLSERGEPVIGWSGLYVQRYLQEFDNSPNWTHSCRAAALIG